MGRTGAEKTEPSVAWDVSDFEQGHKFPVALSNSVIPVPGISTFHHVAVELVSFVGYRFALPQLTDAVFCVEISK